LGPSACYLASEGISYSTGGKNKHGSEYLESCAHNEVYLERDHQPEQSSSEERVSPSLVVYLATM
jgi:hypothetical protein